MIIGTREFILEIRSDFVIFYANKIETSGAYKALKYAKKIKRKFYNLYDNI